MYNARMKRYVDLNELTDGKKYTEKDLVKLPCNGCKGCSDCCHDVSDTIIIDPYDAWQLSTNLGVSFRELLGKGIVELRVVDGLILPHLRILPNSGCVFLDENGRCNIHDFRPGFCRLFPLGRLYENGSFSYILQVDECPNPVKAKIRVKDWIGIENSTNYNDFVLRWHEYTKHIQEALGEKSEDEQKSICLKILDDFYFKDYENFFEEITGLL